MTDQIEMPEEFTAPRGAGPQLRYAREKLGLSVGDIAARTKISQRQVADLEAGNYAAFSSRTYAIGFSRTVAKAVGLDGEAIAALVRGELNALQPAARTTTSYEPSDPARVPSQSLVWFSLVALSLLLAGLFFAYRTLFSPAAELPSLIEQQEAEQAAAAAAAAASPAATPAASGPVTFTATDERVWVSFYDADGLRLLEKELALGESFTVPADANGPMVRTARPEALTITVGGRPVPPLATEMMTMRDVKVDAASLLARPAPLPSAAASPTPAASRAASDAPVRTVPLSQQLPARSTSTAQRPARPAVVRTSAPAGEQDAAAANTASAEAAVPEAAATQAAPPPAAEPAPAAE
jgi:cytoskeleton protein RodZ